MQPITEKSLPSAVKDISVKEVLFQKKWPMKIQKYMHLHRCLCSKQRKTIHMFNKEIQAFVSTPYMNIHK